MKLLQPAFAAKRSSPLVDLLLGLIVFSCVQSTNALVRSSVTAGQPAGSRSPDKAMADSAKRLFARDNLIAWCIVPFDSKKRSPEDRAAMLEKLGFKHFAYDWRGEHIPTFDAEVLALSATVSRSTPSGLPPAS